LCSLGGSWSSDRPPRLSAACPWQAHLIFSLKCTYPFLLPSRFFSDGSRDRRCSSSTHRPARSTFSATYSASVLARARRCRSSYIAGAPPQRRRPSAPSRISFSPTAPMVSRPSSATSAPARIFGDALRTLPGRPPLDSKDAGSTASTGVAGSQRGRRGCRYGASVGSGRCCCSRRPLLLAEPAVAAIALAAAIGGAHH
jgi:hypothetical protein